MEEHGSKPVFWRAVPNHLLLLKLLKSDGSQTKPGLSRNDRGLHSCSSAEKEMYNDERVMPALDCLYGVLGHPMKRQPKHT